MTITADDVTVLIDSPEVEAHDWVSDEERLIAARAAAEVETIAAQGAADLAVAEVLADATAEVVAEAEEAAEVAEASAIVVLADAVVLLSERVAAIEAAGTAGPAGDAAPDFAVLDELPAEQPAAEDDTPPAVKGGRHRWLGTQSKGA